MMPNGEGGKSCLYHDGDKNNNNHFKFLSDLNNKQITIQKPFSSMILFTFPLDQVCSRM